jgi:hypothetical protein
MPSSREVCLATQADVLVDEASFAQEGLDFSAISGSKTRSDLKVSCELQPRVVKIGLLPEQTVICIKVCFQ